MSEFFFDAHVIWQYVTVVAVVTALIFSVRGPEMTSTAEMVYRITAIVVDIQVTLGIALWIMRSGWTLGLMQAWVHPLIGIAAVALLHIFLRRARDADPEEASKLARTGFIFVVLLVVAAIGVGEAA